jgi:hypothetical protein
VAGYPVGRLEPGLRWLDHGRLRHGPGRLLHVISGLVHISPAGSKLVILAGEGSGKGIRVQQSIEDIKSHRSGSTTEQQWRASGQAIMARLLRVPQATGGASWRP